MLLQTYRGLIVGSDGVAGGIGEGRVLRKIAWNATSLLCSQLCRIAQGEGRGAFRLEGELWLWSVELARFLELFLKGFDGLVDGVSLL